MKRDPGLVLVLVAIAAVIAIYAPTLGRGLVNYDDPWLVRDNWIAGEPSLASLQRIWFDLSADTRFVLGAEYLPVRDISVMIDHAVWGDWYGGFHLTNLVVYVIAICVWFAAIASFGVDRRIAGVMMLIWALHPSHAESVAWLAERKGLLGVMFAGVCALGFARYRAGGRLPWLVLAVIAAVCAVWSKAPSAFAIAALAGLELVLPERRASWRRSLIALGAIAVAGMLAFVPVVMVATDAAVVGTEDNAPAGWLAMAMGVHGFYVRLAALAVKNSPSYPIAIEGPTAVDIAIGVAALLGAIAVLVVPRRVPGIARAAAVLWLLGWFPASRLVLPLRNVLVADRFLLIPTLGFALAIAFGVWKIANPRVRAALIAAIALAAALRTLDAQSSWKDTETLWQRAVAVNPKDGNAWSLYAEAISERGRSDIVCDVLRTALQHSDSPRVKLRIALLTLSHGKRSKAIETMREVAEAGEYRAMANLALLLHQDGANDEAIAWARRAVGTAPRYVAGQRARGKIALAIGNAEEALAAFERAYALEPRNLGNRFNLGLALRALGRITEARPHFEACLSDATLGPQARSLL
jgi:tetratricopeptide (TPR) repeat protein